MNKINIYLRGPVFLNIFLWQTIFAKYYCTVQINWFLQISLAAFNRNYFACERDVKKQK